MLIQLTYGAVLIGVTVLIHAVCLEGIITAWRAVSIEIEVRWRAIALSLTIIGICRARDRDLCIDNFLFLCRGNTNMGICPLFLNDKLYDGWIWRSYAL